MSDNLDGRVESTAQCLDLLTPGLNLGDLLRNCYTAVVHQAIQLRCTQDAASSGAEHELDYYTECDRG
jgi:hypothetical protein